jgi:hypothetical protein
MKSINMQKENVLTLGKPPLHNVTNDLIKRVITVNAETMSKHYKFKDTKTLELLVKVHTHHVDELCILLTNV